jgi:hypothetical protein
VLIEEGDYQVQILAANVTTVFQGSRNATKPSGKSGSPRKLVARCRIVYGPHADTELPLFLNLSCAGKKVPQGSKYYESWVIANGYQKPKRRELSRMSPMIFAEKIFLARVRTVKRRADGSEKHPIFWYSIVDELLSLEAGGNDPSGEERGRKVPPTTLS